MRRNREQYVASPHIASFARVRPSLEATLVNEPVVALVDEADDVRVHWKAYRRASGVPVFTYALEREGLLDRRYAVYVDVAHTDGRVAFPEVFLEMAATGKEVVFCVNDGLGQSYLLDATPQATVLLQHAPSVRFVVEMAYLTHGDASWTTHMRLPDDGEWMYKTKVAPLG